MPQIMPSKRLDAIVVVLAALLMSAPAFAIPITYIESGIASGTLGTSSFTNQFVTITGTGDTIDVFGGPNFALNMNLSSVTINVTTVGSATTTALSVFDHQTTGPTDLSFAGFTVTSGGNLFMITGGAAFDTYDLRTAIGPILAFGFCDGNCYPTPTIVTSAGNFSLSSVANQPGSLSDFTTFTATTSAPVVPLPGALPLFATILGALGVFGWRKKKNAKW